MTDITAALVKMSREGTPAQKTAAKSMLSLEVPNPFARGSATKFVSVSDAPGTLGFLLTRGAPANSAERRERLIQSITNRLWELTAHSKQNRLSYANHVRDPNGRLALHGNTQATVNILRTILRATNLGNNAAGVRPFVAGAHRGEAVRRVEKFVADTQAMFHDKLDDTLATMRADVALLRRRYLERMRIQRKTREQLNAVDNAFTKLESIVATFQETARASIPRDVPAPNQRRMDLVKLYDNTVRLELADLVQKRNGLPRNAMQSSGRILKARSAMDELEGRYVEFARQRDELLKLLSKIKRTNARFYNNSMPNNTNINAIAKAASSTNLKYRTDAVKGYTKFITSNPMLRALAT